MIRIGPKDLPWIARKHLLPEDLVQRIWEESIRRATESGHHRVDSSEFWDECHQYFQTAIEARSSINATLGEAMAM
jgi:hypothetical protein